METKEMYVHLANISQSLNDYKSTVQALTKAAAFNIEFTEEERNTLTIAAKCVIQKYRVQWTLLLIKETDEENASTKEMIRRYRMRIHIKLFTFCKQLVQLLDEHLIPCATTEESKLFYYTKLGDYYRYIAEFLIGEEQVANNSLNAYRKAMEIAVQTLPPTHPKRLGLVLNVSVSMYSICNSPAYAYELAKSAYDTAFAALQHSSYEHQVAALPMIDTLYDRITIWTNYMYNNVA